MSTTLPPSLPGQLCLRCKFDQYQRHIRHISWPCTDISLWYLPEEGHRRWPKHVGGLWFTYNVITSHNFIRTRWFYSYTQDIVTNECIRTIYTKMYHMYDTCFIRVLPFNFVRMPMHRYSRVHVGSNPVSYSADPAFKPRNGDRRSWFSSVLPVQNATSH